MDKESIREKGDKCTRTRREDESEGDKNETRRQNRTRRQGQDKETKTSQCRGGVNSQLLGKKSLDTKEEVLYRCD